MYIPDEIIMGDKILVVWLFVKILLSWKLSKILHSETTISSQESFKSRKGMVGESNLWFNISWARQAV